MLIGITGGIGTGKSRVAILLGGLLNSPVFSADEICKQFMEPGGDGYREFIKRSGEHYLDSSGRLNRALLRTDIFQDQKLKSELESILHPLVRSKLHEELSKRGPGAMIIAEVPLLYESGWQDDFDVIVVVHASTDVSLSRAVARDNDDISAVEKIIANQMGREKKREMADHVIDNSGEWRQTAIQVNLLALTLRKQFEDSVGLEK